MEICSPIAEYQVTKPTCSPPRIALDQRLWTSAEAGARPISVYRSELTQGIADLIGLGWGPAIVKICATLHLDGGWIETLALDEMIKLYGVSSH